MSTELVDPMASVRAYLAAEKSSSTRRAYRSDWAHFSAWFAAALRRSELVDLKVKDVEWRPKGILLHLRRSKTDQEGKGRAIPVPRGRALKPVAALEAWLQASGIAEGPIFREVDRHGRVGKK